MIKHGSFKLDTLSEWLSRQAEEIVIMRGDGLGQISLSLWHSLIPK